MTRQKTNQVPKDVRAVIYTRISVDRETQSSIANQLRECRETLSIHGIPVVGEFSDVGKSAFKLDVERPGFDQALRMLETGEANQLVVWKLDRMTRNARGFHEINSNIESWGGTFRSIKEPWFDTSSPIGYAIVGLMAALAQMETENIQGRILSWHEGRRKNGDVPIGPTPYGYVRPQEGQEGWRKGGALIIEPDQKAIIEEMATRALMGDPLREIARDLTARDVPTPSNGKTWNHTSVRKIILSPTVAAMYADGREGESWDAIIARDEWRQLHLIFSDAERLEGFDCSSRVPTHLLTNLMECGKCDAGSLMNTHSSSKGRKYRCKSCNSVIVATVAESVVEEFMLENVTNAKWRAMRAAGKGRDESLIADLEQRIEELTIDYYSRKGKRNEMRPSVYASINDDLSAQLDAAMSEPMMDLPEVASLRESWADMSIADKRKSIVAAIESVVIEPLPAGAKPCTATARKRVVIRGK
jgi:site-specific DNA recombinase